MDRMTPDRFKDLMIEQWIERTSNRLKEATMSNRLVCPEDGMEIDVNLSIDDIDNFEAHCPKCGEEMVFMLSGFFNPELPMDFESEAIWA